MGTSFIYWLSNVCWVSGKGCINADSSKMMDQCKIVLYQVCVTESFLASFILHFKLTVKQVVYLSPA